MEAAAPGERVVTLYCLVSLPLDEPDDDTTWAEQLRSDVEQAIQKMRLSYAHLSIFNGAYALRRVDGDVPPVTDNPRTEEEPAEPAGEGLPGPELDSVPGDPCRICIDADIREQEQRSNAERIILNDLEQRRGILDALGFSGYLHRDGPVRSVFPDVHGFGEEQRLQRPDADPYGDFFGPVDNHGQRRPGRHRRP